MDARHLQDGRLCVLPGDGVRPVSTTVPGATNFLLYLLWFRDFNRKDFNRRERKERKG